LALVYLERAERANARAPITELTVHRLVSTALALAIKFHDDIYFNNDDYANMVGVTLEELNEAEKQLLKVLDWRLLVCAEEFDATLQMLL